MFVSIHINVPPSRRTDLVRLQLHGAIYRPDSFVLVPRYCANLKAIRYESTSLNRIVADKSDRVIAALEMYQMKRFIDIEQSPSSMFLLLSTWFLFNQLSSVSIKPITTTTTTNFESKQSD